MIGLKFKTQRLTLRRFRRRDVSTLPPLLNDWDVARWLARTPYPYTTKDARDWIGISRSVWRRSTGYSLAVTKTSSGDLIGGVGVSQQSGEIGYWIGQPYWGRGFGTEAVREVLRLGFEVMDLPDLWANVLPDNKASRNLLEKLGFEERGTRPYAFRSLEKTTIYYTLPRWQWQANQSNGSKAS